MECRVFISSEDKPLIFDRRPAHRAAEPVVVEIRLARNRSARDRVLRQVVDGVVVLFLVIPFAGPMPIVRAGLGHQAELTARGMPVLRAELIRREVKFRNGVWNDRGVVSRYAQVVVIHTVYREIVVARARSANRSANSGYAARLGDNVGRQHCEIERAAVELASAIRKKLNLTP